jgi:hypothetical protein
MNKKNWYVKIALGMFVQLVVIARNIKVSPPEPP